MSTHTDQKRLTAPDIRARKGASPIVMLTSSYIDIYDVGAEGGPDAFVVRPFAREVLANAVDRILHRR